MGANNLKSTVVVPSLDGYRNGLVPRLLESIERQTYRNYDLELVKGVSPQGRAINLGAARGDGDLIIIIDDDAELVDEGVLERLVETIESDPTIGMAGASIVTSPSATPFQVRAGRQFPRLNTPVVDSITDSDLACHGCCAIPRKVFDEIGGEREDILRGLDPDLRVRLRAAGYRVVLAPHARIYHPLPDGWRNLLRTFFRNGYGSAYAQKFQPDAIYDTHEALDSASFTPRRSLAYRIFRYPFRLAGALLRGQFMRLWAYTAYVFGYAWGMMTAERIAVSSHDTDH